LKGIVNARPAPRLADRSPEALGRLGGEPRRITAVRGSQLGSEKELVFRARQFMDATGDGTIGFLGGADFRYGREARAEFGENLAPLTSDETTMGSTITMRARDIGRVTPFVPPPWIQIYKTLDEIGHKRTLYHLSKPVYGGYWWLEICNPFHQIHDNQEIRDVLTRIQAVNAQVVVKIAEADKLRGEATDLIVRANALNGSLHELRRASEGMIAIATRIEKAVK